jgi:septum formation topological specificity factor MinE
MDDEKRKGEKAIPDNVEDYLNELQQEILIVVGKYGWSLKFVRRSASKAPVIVIEDADGKTIGVLEENGAINYESGIVLREGNS